jgi:hypothetical protein
MFIIGAQIERLTMDLMWGTRKDFSEMEELEAEDARLRKLLDAEDQRKRYKEAYLQLREGGGDVDKENPSDNNNTPGVASGNEPSAANGIVEELSEQLSLNTPAICAFVVFNHCESKARCIEDFEHFSKFPFNLKYPDELKFKGQKIFCKRSPEPDEILWENLETSKKEQGFRVLFTSVVTFILIFVGFIIILQAAKMKQKFNDQVLRVF